MTSVAVLAQLVEHHFRKVGVWGSNPQDGSIPTRQALRGPQLKAVNIYNLILSYSDLRIRG